MFFTQEDYRKIEEYLKKKSIKDTQFDEAITPLDGTEEVAFVQKGKNVKAHVKDIVDQLFLLGVSDFLNVTDKYHQSYIDLKEAIDLIPFLARKKGQVITFINKEGDWVIYQYKGTTTLQWSNITLWVNLFESIYINSILPDEEDLTKTSPDEQGNVRLKLKDKIYNSEEFSGLGRVYLRKNITEGKNVLLQEMISEANTIYHIQYDYDLDGKDITIPTNCTLKFEGGSFKNGTINGNNTTNIESNYECLYKCKLKSFKNIILNIIWFKDKIEDVLSNVQQCNLHFDSKSYNITSSIYLNAEVIIIGNNTTFNLNNSIYLGWRNTIKNINFKAPTANNELSLLIIDSKNIMDSINKLDTPEDTHYGYIGIEIKKCKFINSSIGIKFILSKERSGWGFDILYNRFIYTKLGIGFEIKEEDSKEDIWFTDININYNRFTEGGSGILFKDVPNKGKINYFEGITISYNSLQHLQDTNYFITLNNVSYVNIINNRIWDTTTDRYFINKVNCRFVNIDDGLPNQKQYSISYFSSNPSDIDVDSSVKILNNQYDNFLLTLPSPLNGNFYTFNDFKLLSNGYYSLNLETVKKIIDDQSLTAFSDSFGLKLETLNTIYKRITIIPLNANSYNVPANDWNYIEFVAEFYTNKQYDDNTKISLNSFRYNSSSFLANYNNIPYKYKGMVFWERNYNVLGTINRHGDIVAYDGFKINANRFGATKNRPVLSEADRNFMYYDWDIRNNIWWNGDGWVDSYGISVDAKRVGTFEDKPKNTDGIKEGFAYYCTDKQTTEGARNGIMIYYAGDNTWVDSLGRVVE